MTSTPETSADAPRPIERYGRSAFRPGEEAVRLLRGEGRYTDDVAAPGAAWGVFVRSDHAHGVLRGLDTAEARAEAGVLAVLTAEDLTEAGIRPLPCTRLLEGRDGRPAVSIPQYPLARGRVAYVGQPLALVVAETAIQAQDAAERILADIDPLPAVTGPAEAAAEGAPQIWDEAPGNLCLDWAAGDEAAVARAMAAAAHVARVRLVNNRLAPVSLEPRAVLAEWDAATGRLTLVCGNQSAPTLRDTMAGIMGVEPAQMRVVTPQVGGGFGSKSPAYPEYAPLLHAARVLGRPVRWRATRTEAFLSDIHGRDSVIEGALALDAEGRFQALDLRVVAGLGPFTVGAGLIVATFNTKYCLAGLYDPPAIHLSTRLVFTNTVPTGPYRGAGRPEAAFVIERLVDRAARETGRDPVELRRRNLVAPFREPRRMAMGEVYDSGDYPAVLERALALADHAGFPARRAEAASRGRLRGLGLAGFVEAAGAYPTEAAAIRARADGTIEVRTPAQSNGQRHADTLGGLVAARLGVAEDRILVIEGDSDATPPGAPSVGSRTAMMSGAAVDGAAAALIRTGLAEASDALEAAAADIVYEAGRFTVAGTDRAVTLEALAGRRPEGALEASDRIQSAGQSFPNGVHVAEIEIDPETGRVEVVRYTAVDDVGRALNPPVVEGQVMGGIAQGLGQVLTEAVAFDADGQMLTATFMDYGIPRADDLPALNVAEQSVPSPSTPLGAKGAGEAGTTGALPTLANALHDALAQAGVEHFDLPATPARVWRALSEAAAARGDAR